MTRPGGRRPDGRPSRGGRPSSGGSGGSGAGGGGRGPRGGARPPAAPRAIPGDAPVVALRVDSIAAGGDGVARHEGLVVFVPRTAPGDLARVAIAPQGRMARGALAQVVEPSPQRVDPPCPHYVHDHCGGCQLQHLHADAQRAAKRQIVQDALVRLGRGVLPDDVAVTAVAASPYGWRYRRKLTLALRRRGDGWIAGLHPYDAPGQVFPLADCPITDARVVVAWRAVLAAQQFLPEGMTELRGAVRLLGEDASGAGAPDAGHETAAEGSPDPDAPWVFVLEGARRWGGWEPFAHAVRQRSPGFAALWWAREPAAGQPRAEPRLLVDHRGGEAAHGAAFVQVNPGVAARLHARVVERARAHAPSTVVDAYAGAGDTAIPLAAAGARVTAIELDRAAVAHAADRLPAGSRAVAGFVERHLADALPADVVIVNPPRGGLHEEVAAILERAAAGAYGPPPRALLYVSCNPATLARDLARLPAWRVTAVEPFDMFPQTAHVETLVELVPSAAARTPAPEGTA